MLLCFLLWLYYMLLPASPPLTATHTALAADGQSFQVATPSGRTRKKKLYAKLLLTKSKSRCFWKMAWLGFEIGVRVCIPVDTFCTHKPDPCASDTYCTLLSRVYSRFNIVDLSVFIYKNMYSDPENDTCKYKIKQNKTNKNQKRTRTKQNKQTKSSRLLNTTEWILTA